MKKNIFRIFSAIIIMTLVIAPPLAYSSLLSMAVHKITPSALRKMGGGSAKIPAVVKSVSTNGKTAMNVLNLTLTGAQFGGLAGAVIGTGIGLGIYAANPSWFIQNGIRVLTTVGGVDIVKDTTVQVPPADVAPEYDYNYNFPESSYADGAEYGIGYYGSDCAAADAALLSKCQSLHWEPWKCDVWDFSPVNCIQKKRIKVTLPKSQSYLWFYIYAYCQSSTSCGWDHVPLTQSESIGPSGLADTLGPQLGQNDPKAWGLLMDILNRISGALNNPSNEMNAEPGLMDDIQSRLQQGISANALSGIETSTDEGTGDGAVPADENDVYGGVNGSDVFNGVIDALKGQGLSDKKIAEAIQAALAAGGLTAADIAESIWDAAPDGIADGAGGLTAADIAQHIWDAAPNAITDPTAGAGVTDETVNSAANAIDAAIDQAAADIVDAIKNEDEGSNVVVPVDPDVLVPEKLSLTSVLNDFYSGLQNLPMIQTFQGMAITSGGSSTLCVDLPTQFGGSQCVNFSSYEGSLNSIGSILLSMTTLIMMVYLLRG